MAQLMNEGETKKGHKNSRYYLKYAFSGCGSCKNGNNPWHTRHQAMHKVNEINRNDPSV